MSAATTAIILTAVVNNYNRNNRYIQYVGCNNCNRFNSGNNYITLPISAGITATVLTAGRVAPMKKCARAGEWCRTLHADLLDPGEGFVGEVPVDEADQQALQLRQVLDDEAPVIGVVHLQMW